MSLEEQIYIWNKAKTIACINGTIPLNVVFSCNEDLELIILNKTSIPHENPHFFSYTRGIEGVYIDVFCEPLKKYPRSLGEGPFLLKCTDEFKYFCNQKGLENFQTENKTDRYFKNKTIHYYISILAIKRRTKSFIRRLIPNSLIAKLKKDIHNLVNMLM